MLFLLLFANVQCKNALANPVPTPESYPLSVSVYIMDSEGPKDCKPRDPDCPTTNFSDPSVYKCGQVCLAEGDKTTFSYTFKGVQFLVYGSKSKDYKSFDLIFDNVKLQTINENQEENETNVLLYTSRVYPYGEHTIKVKGRPGERFSLFKFAYWPHLKSQRLNISEMQITGNWKLESDEIGGTRMFSRSQGASASLTIEASKLWVYGTPDPGHGDLRISFNTIDKVVNTAYTRKDHILLFESEEIPTTFHQLDLVQSGTKPVLIYCVYYLYDPPQPTRNPKPSRTPVPGTNMDFIDKKFTGKDIIQIDNGKDPYKNVKQISGCTFKNLIKQQGKVYFIRLDSPILFYDNRVEFDTASTSNPAPLFLTQSARGEMTISRCTFIKCASSNTDDGNAVNIRGYLDLFIEDSRFVNCFQEGILGQAVVQYNEDRNNLVKFTDCTFQFSSAAGACHAFNGNNSKLIFNRCTFSKCGAAILTNNVNQFEFTDNVVTSAGQDLIKIDNLLKVSPIITGNTFKFNEISNSNSITLIHNVEKIEITNNSFISNSLIGKGQTVEGGGVGLFIKKSTDTASTLYFTDCIFSENKNSHSDSGSNEGGALHLSSSQNTELIIQRCQFTDNKSPQGKGAAISTTLNKDVTIEDCIFEGNVAKDQGNVLYINQGGADTVKLSITGCKFIDNGDNGKSKIMISGNCVGLEIDSCEVRYSNIQQSGQAISLTVNGVVTLSNTNFTNCTTTNAASVLFTQSKDGSAVTINKCHYLNCKANGFVVQVSGGKSDVSECTLTFDKNDASSACGGVKFVGNGFSCTYCSFVRMYSSGALAVNQANTQTDPVDVSNCVFDDCGGGNTRCFNMATFTSSLTFSNNEIKNMKQGGHGSYFGSINCNSKVDTLEFRQITFIDNTCNSLYGGGTGLWITKAGTFYFNDCKFINNVALTSTGESRHKSINYYQGDGGGIQYGFSASIYKINMKFENCLFSRNKAVRHGGAVALQTIQDVEIISCTFEENVANYKPPSSSANLLAENYYDLKAEGRGGAIYINPSFNDNKNNDATMKSVKIEKCTFTSNSAFDGFAIYIEGDNDGTTITINNNKFTNNYDRTENSINRGVILSEFKFEFDVSSNTFENPSRYKVLPIVFSDHSARTPSPSPMATTTNKVPTEGECDPQCSFVNTEEHEPIVYKPQKKEFDDILNETSHGSAIYIKNSGLEIVDSKFTKCRSPNNGGGAIYVDTEVDNVNHSIIIENTFFKGCESLYGGAIYVHSPYECSPVTIKSCIFDTNKALSKNTRDNLFGGSAIYMHVRDGTVFNCSFNHNTGKGGAVRLINDFDVSNSKLLSRNLVVISHCLFEINKDQSSSIFYHGGKFGSEFQVRNCEFFGVLNKNAHHIDGIKTNEKSPNLDIMNCKFADDYKASLNTNGNYFSINLKEQEFGGSSDQPKQSLSSFNFVYVAVLAVAALLAVAAAVIVAKKSNKISEEEEEEMVEESL